MNDASHFRTAPTRVRLPRTFRTGLACAIVVCVTCATLPADEPAVIPHRQTRPPNAPRSPDEAAAKMTVPEGFRVEVVAAEPDLVNPVAMTFDERGRIWVTESLEYPRHAPGPGRDRIKVLEDTDGDGRADKVTVFAEGLNIPSGIAVGMGGVWVANAPDILFMQDTDGDGRADKQEVVVTGFGRADTHELPNSLTWGPDGWLYGLNGVFNPSHVKQGDREYRFTCALFRIHPRTRRFELFCEGTSNPWGVAWDHEGSAFVSACVIDHLWHLVESGYYHRQGGPYPPFTWKIGSIVDHKHQLAAYCGIHFFDSDAYPAKYREKLYMGNIHGNCVNVDVLARRGASYFATAQPDFLVANDAWFMPVVQKTGPDGCLYVLDWYDRYHCYQDANRDPAGIDRLKGRLYRVRYQDTPRAGQFDLAGETDVQLVERLKSPNVYYRDVAQRLLCERAQEATRAHLVALVFDDGAAYKSRMHALWALIGQGAVDEALRDRLFAMRESSFRAWAVRAAGNANLVDDEFLRSAIQDSSPDVQLQGAIAAGKAGNDRVELLIEAAARAKDDSLLARIVWQNLHPLLEDQGDTFVSGLKSWGLRDSTALREIVPRAIERLLAARDFAPQTVSDLCAWLLSDESGDGAVGRRCLALLAEKVQTREFSVERQRALKPLLTPLLETLLAGAPSTGGGELGEAALLAATWKVPAGVDRARNLFRGADVADPLRLRALDALVAADDKQLLEVVGPLLSAGKSSVELRRGVLDALGRCEDARVADAVLAAYASLPPELQPLAVELLTQRPAWAKALLAAVADKEIPAAAINLSQVRKLQSTKDAELQRQVTSVWGTVRGERNPVREQVIADMRSLIRQTPGDAHRGQQVFVKLCGQCHKIFGQGQDVGPDITLNGRSSFEQLLSNVFDPSLVIGSAYQARTVVTSDGRALVGLVVEDSPQRIVLKVQGGKLETIARADVEETSLSKLSLMPEGVETQLKPQEIVDLFAFITLDKPPSDPTARQLPGVRAPTPRETLRPAEFNELLAEVAPGFTVEASGERGVGLVAEHMGRPFVVRTHPVDREKPCVLRSPIEIPKGKRTRLLLTVSHDPRGDWRLVVRTGGKTLHDSIVGAETTRGGWADLAIDLSSLAGRRIELEVLNQANGWSYEFAYWGRVEVVVDEAK